LLRLAVSDTGSSLRIVVGEPPTIRVRGTSNTLAGPALNPKDTEELMRSITPEHCIQEVCERGTAEFGFAFGDRARFHARVLKGKKGLTIVLRQFACNA